MYWGFKVFKQIRDKNPNTRFIASWSGGKDSTFMVDELLRRDDPLDEVVFCDTGWEFPEMYDYIEQCKAYWQDKYPKLKVTLLNWKTKHTIPNHMRKEITKGDNAGKKRGFPFPIGVGWCTARFKIDPTKKYWSEKYKGFDVYEYIGIAADEPKRIPNDWENGTKLYPLVEWNISEPEVNPILIKRGLFNPLYNHFNRTGCWACPKQGFKKLAVLKENYPQLWSELEALEKEFDGLEPYTFDTEKTQPYKFKGIGLEVVNEKVDAINSNKSFDFDDDEPIGCFCK
jgi:3'-phosphoadenosine 5'-phosphosulfate sulfotransferase (PAPS reductase)/FAD synthetase